MVAEVRHGPWKPGFVFNVRNDERLLVLKDPMGERIL
jgi:hypothetical protein